jgi:predicted enzyme related to lactoylglutathione lyase
VNIQVVDLKPPRGLKLKTVSSLTMVLALFCLAAFAVGRPPALAGVDKESAMFLGLRTAVYQVKDLAQAKAWYAKVLETSPYFDQSFYVGFNVGGCELGLVPSEDATPRRVRSGTAYWRVSDASAAYRRLLELGAAPEEPVTDVGEGILVGAVHDPFGNILGVIQTP